MKLSRRLFLMTLLVQACQVKSLKGEPLIVGMVSYDKGEEIINQYDSFKRYLEQRTRSLVELEPTFNEKKAIERIRSQAWSLVFAPPGLATLAMTHYQYIPLLPLEGISQLRSLIVVRQDSPFQDLKSLNGQTLALGQIGSATGYYIPIFNLYGLTIRKISFVSTPKVILDKIAEGEVAAGALSIKQFNTYQTQFKSGTFRVLFTDTHNIPAGVILISPSIGLSRREEILQILNETPSIIANEAGFVPYSPIPNYRYMIAVVKRVNSIFPETTQIDTENVRLFSVDESYPQ